MPPKKKNEDANEASPMRLDSLNRRSNPMTPVAASAIPSSSGTRGRFAPKAVARRSKEDRDASAPAEQKSETSKGEKRFTEKSRRGGTAGGRGRGGRFEPVTMSSAAVGPLSSPSQPERNSASNTGSRFSGKLQVKREGEGSREKKTADSFSTSSFSTDNRIDMSVSSKSGIPPGMETYFPIRMEKDASDDLSNGDVKEEDRNTVKVKEEPGLDEASNEQHSNANTRTTTTATKPNISEEVLELERKKKDYEAIASEFKIDSSSSEGSSDMEKKLYFFQFPAIMPSFKNFEEDAAQEQEQDPNVMTVDEDDNNDSNKEQTTSKPIDGLAGKLQLHKSGKLTMTLGSICMEVAQGTECRFLQEVMILDKKESKAYQIGPTTRKLVVLPQLEQFDQLA